MVGDGATRIWVTFADPEVLFVEVLAVLMLLARVDLASELD